MSLPISHIMLAKVVKCDEITTLRRIVELLRTEHVGSLLVMHGEQVAGIITTQDVLGAVLDGRDLAATCARDIMSSPVDSIPLDMGLEDALREFERTGRNRLAVMSADRVAGVLKKTVAERFKGLTGMYTFTKSPTFRHGSSSATS
jgi:CBS domain-containing protein